MAKVSVKKSPSAPAKKTAAPRAKSKPKTASAVSIDKACEQALSKLSALKIESQLQADIAWCLGSFRHDNNPVGLYQVGAIALDVLTAEKAKNAKSVPTKVISDLKKALKQA